MQLNFKEYGSGNNYLLILHGFLGSLDNWQTLATEWGNAGIHVFAIDQRNHGKSPHTNTHTIAQMVEDVKEFMTQNNIPQASILGHSMGGKVAMQFALSYASLTHKLIVADISPRAYRPGTNDDVFNAIENVDLTTAQTRKEIEQAMAVYLGDFGTRQFVMKGLDRQADGKYQWKFNITTLKKEYPNILAEVQTSTPFYGETLFINGGNSLYIQEKDIPLIQNLFPNYKLQTISNAGHWLHAEKPNEVFSAILNFIQ
ncbi:MAG: alpha/beta fold hydrolase [Bacteroidia bacterium]|nr:alpha/beta fold hydrolase [Bacteroidia bacterium]